MDPMDKPVLARDLGIFAAEVGGAIGRLEVGSKRIVRQIVDFEAKIEALERLIAENQRRIEDLSNDKT
jgi:hypothetical protein